MAVVHLINFQSNIPDVTIVLVRWSSLEVNIIALLVRSDQIGQINGAVLYIVSLHHVTSTIPRIVHQINDAFTSLKEWKYLLNISRQVGYMTLLATTR